MSTPGLPADCALDASSCCSGCDGFVGGGTLDGVCPGGTYPVNVSVVGNILTFDGSPYGITVSGPLGGTPAQWSASSPCPPTTIDSVFSGCTGGVPFATVQMTDSGCSCTWFVTI